MLNQNTLCVFTETRISDDLAIAQFDKPINASRFEHQWIVAADQHGSSLRRQFTK